MKLLKLLTLFTMLTACGEDDSGSREVVQIVSPDGRDIWFMPIIEDGVTDITITVAWPSDWSYNPANNPAVPYIASEVILSGGTDTLKPQDLMEVFNDANAGGWLTAAADYTYGELGFPREHTDQIVPIAASMLANPQLDPAWVSRVSAGLRANQEQGQAQSTTKMWMAARKAIFDDAPILGYLSLPDTTMISDVTPEMVSAWHVATLTQDVPVIVVTGAINAQDAGEAVDTLLGQLPVGPARPAQESAANFAQRTILLHLPEAEKTTIGYLGQLPPTSGGGDLIDALAVQVLSDGSGPLFEAIRTEMRATYGLQVGYANFDRATRLMFITGEIATPKLAQAHEVILETYADFRASPALDRLGAIRDTVAERTDIDVAYVNVAAQTIRELALDGQDPTIAPNLGDAVRAITDQDVIERLQSAFPKAEDLIVIVASPDATALPDACVITEISQAAMCP